MNRLNILKSFKLNSIITIRVITLSSIVAVRKSGKNASSSNVKNSSCVSIPYTRSKKSTTLCLWPGISPDGMSLFGRSWPAAGFCRVNLRLKTPCRSSRGTNDRRIALARNDSFLPYKYISCIKLLPLKSYYADTESFSVHNETTINSL